MAALRRFGKSSWRYLSGYGMIYIQTSLGENVTNGQTKDISNACIVRSFARFTCPGISGAGISLSLGLCIQVAPARQRPCRYQEHRQNRLGIRAERHGSGRGTRQARRPGPGIL